MGKVSYQSPDEQRARALLQNEKGFLNIGDRFPSEEAIRDLLRRRDEAKKRVAARQQREHDDRPMPAVRQTGSEP